MADNKQRRHDQHTSNFMPQATTSNFDGTAKPGDKQVAVAKPDAVVEAVALFFQRQSTTTGAQRRLGSANSRRERRQRAAAKADR